MKIKKGDPAVCPSHILHDFNNITFSFIIYFINPYSMQLPVKYSTLDWRKGEKAIVREEYIRLQNGICFHCNFPLNESPPQEILSKDINWNLFPPNFLKFPIHLQHCHKTDMTEGAVHAYCNAVLWQYHGR